ncbi:hypothetical protein BKA67DRAFT_573338 [Truncatella angustata]|uniref:Uncharacterized protein n=1 Tax=Truncatella angustata TaxID=152316 RepID=A0A9P8UHK1_9PEZI|nr:uncharacterized protein BKA67DRAFT_573338 [Truncatella angustata]KAH6652219.1 hypothetical protein BKA67DRAFT_573338 [Truncatella angustata]KAH8196675.1 hypothetical protein TruAng_009143 [Truncatella angustata]
MPFWTHRQYDQGHSQELSFIPTPVSDDTRSQDLSFIPTPVSDDAQSHAQQPRYSNAGSWTTTAVDNSMNDNIRAQEKYTGRAQTHQFPTSQSAFDHGSEEHVPGSTSRHQRRTRLGATRAWAWEIVSLLVAIGLIVAIFVILAKQHNKPVDDWTFVLNLNSLIALLSTIYRAAIVVIAAEIISQEKWTVFWSSKNPQPLQNFKRFDAASRGIWGAVRILSIAVRHSLSASLCAIIILISFAVGPFTQQAIGTVNRDHLLQDSNPPYLPVAHAVDDTNLSFVNTKGALFGGRDLNADAQTSMFSAFLNPRSNDLKIDTDCSTGNCIFRSLQTGSLSHTQNETTHHTAGMCSSCFDVSSLIQARKSSGGPTTYLLPDGTNQTSLRDPSSNAPILVVNTVEGMSWAGDVISQEQQKQFRWAAANVTILTFGPADESEREGGDVSKPVAVACSLYPCLRSYSASVSGGNLSESLVRSEPMFADWATKSLENDTIADMDSWGVLPVYKVAAVAPSCLLNGTVYTTSNYSSYGNTTEVQIVSPDNAPDYPSVQVPEQCVFRFDTFLLYLTGGFLKERVFTGYCNSGYSIACYEKYWLAQFYNNGDASADVISEIFSNFAEAMTKRYRLGLARPVDAANSMAGVAVERLPFNVIEWQWLTFPLVLLAILMVALLWIIARTIRYRGEEMVWKSNPLPVFYHRDRFVDAYGMQLRDLDGPLQHEKQEMELLTIGEMEKDAKKIQVQLLRGTRWLKAEDKADANPRRPSRVRDMDSDSLMEG